jgi:tetratricopeptide (TPR) repeat protein
VLVIFSDLISCWAHEQETTSPPSAGERYGFVHFLVSCTPAAQEQFDRAITMLHSFFYPETVKAFTKVADIDPQCAMAYWGIAISQRPNPLVGPWDNATLARGSEAIAKGKTLVRTEREKDWLTAMELFFMDYEKLDQSVRTKLFETAMGELYRKYPDDDEAGVFYALALNETVLLSDKTYAQQLKAAAILEALDAKHPNHPGIAHYIIHSYDYRPLAERGLSAANKYARIAPSAPHALHMPSHIYTTLGLWQESITSNQAALAAAKAYAAKNFGPGVSEVSESHHYDFMAYAYLQLGQDRQAKRIVEEVQAIKKTSQVRIDTALAAVPARYVLERAAWHEAAALQPRASQYPYTEAIGYFTRAMGATHTNENARASEDIAKLEQLHKAALSQQQGYWAQQIEVLIRAASAWVALADANHSLARKLMTEATDLEDASEKHVAMENRLYPMRELLGYMLLELKEPRLALTEFEASLEETPNRLRGVYGAAHAAALAHDWAKAREYYTKLAALSEKCECTRGEFEEANSFLAKR